MYVSLVLTNRCISSFQRNHFRWLAKLCYVWVLTRVLLEISFLIYLNALIGSGIPQFVRYGQELFINFSLQIYFIVVVAMFIRESRMEFNNLRAIKPINIIQGEHEEYLSTERKNKFFNSATSFHFLTPQFYLHAKTVSADRLLSDQSVLQYTLTKSIVRIRDSIVDTERFPFCLKYLHLRMCTFLHFVFYCLVFAPHLASQR